MASNRRPLAGPLGRLREAALGLRGVEGEGRVCPDCGQFQECRAWLEEHARAVHGGGEGTAVSIKFHQG
jgi:hypothetical protein